MVYVQYLCLSLLDDCCNGADSFSKSVDLILVPRPSSSNGFVYLVVDENEFLDAAVLFLFVGIAVLCRMSFPPLKLEGNYIIVLQYQEDF